MKPLLCSCPWIPPEWIRAHGFVPVRPRQFPSVPLPNGVCPYAALYAAAVTPDHAGAIFSTACDQMRRISESVAGAPVFLFNQPATWQTPVAQLGYRQELRRLGRWLVALGGQEPSAAVLAETLMGYESARETLRGLSGRISGRRMQAAFDQLYSEGTLAALEPEPDIHIAIPLGLVGGPLVNQAVGLFDLLEAHEARILFNGTEGGWDLVPARQDRRVLRDDPFEAMAAASLAQPGIFQRPNSPWYRDLADRIARQGLKGIVYWQHPWCDLWHGEVQRLRAWSPVPVLHLTANDDGQLDAHATGRLEAFLEMFER